MTTELRSTPNRTSTTRKVIPRLVIGWVALPSFFLITAGSIAWWEAWAYCAIVLVTMTVFVLRTLRTDPDFIERRLTMREKERSQRRLLAWGAPVAVALFILPGLDHRFGWSSIPVAAEIAGLAVVLAGYLATLRVFAVNRWAGRTVETRPGQQVIDTGPYAIVRHPMYSSTSILYLATPIALGSWWTLIPAVLYVVVLVVRIGNEEQVLVRELPGYAEYRAKVRYRLLPGLW
jgi:protein-S-isoprenylcysteine O-methyltransferase Ste14